MKRRGRWCLRPVTQADVPKVRLFLRHFEYSCTALARLFVRRLAPEAPFDFTLPLRNFCFVLEYVPSEHSRAKNADLFRFGLLNCVPSGTLYHCLPFMDARTTGDKNFYFAAFSEQDKNDIRLLCAELLEQQRFSCIMGTGQTGLFLEHISECDLSLRPKETRPCTLMSLDTQEAEFLPLCRELEAHARRGLCFRRCTLSDCDKLFPLMQAYYKEEVLPAGAVLDNRALRVLLNGRLQNEVMYAAEDGTGNFIAAAGTTALGMHCARIGGVYTLPAFRAEGIAAALVSVLCAELLHLRYTPVLFVRDINTAAGKLYAKPGFTARGPYRIAYF